MGKHWGRFGDSMVPQVDGHFTIKEACKLFPPINGRHPCAHTVSRWIRVGILVHGQRVKLGASKIGCRTAVSRQDVIEFIRRTNATPSTEPTSAEMEARAAAAKEHLRKLGMYVR